MKVAFLTDAFRGLPPEVAEGVEPVVMQTGPDKRYAAEDLAKLADVDALMVGAQPCGEDVLAAAPKVRIINTMGVGFDTIDLDAAARRGIPVCNNAGVNKESVAEYLFMHILNAAKHFNEAQAVTREGRWADRVALSNRVMELKGRTLGIIGLGNTGTALARRAKAFEMGIVYNDTREIEPRIVEELGARAVEKDDLFRMADVVAVCTDLNPTSRGMVTPERIGLMQPHALFICCARGNIVDEQALADALNEGRIAAAGLDVFSEEPAPTDNPLLHARNCTVTPHLAGPNPATHKRSMEWALDNIRAVVERGETPQRVVNGVG